MRRTTEQYNVLMRIRSLEENLAEAKRERRSARHALRRATRARQRAEGAHAAAPKVALHKLGPPRSSSSVWPTVLTALSMRWLKK